MVIIFFFFVTKNQCVLADGQRGQGLILKDKAVSSLALLELSFESCISQGPVVPAFNPSSPSAGRQRRDKHFPLSSTSTAACFLFLGQGLTVELWLV